MEKRKWPWKKSSERSPGETESSGSISSHSEKYSDDQETMNVSPNHNEESPEVASKTIANAGQDDDSVKRLTEKLSAVLVNVSAKEDLVKQHSKVAEEAVAGWEKAENEVASLKQKLEAAVKQNFTLEDRVSHLDGALKECVRQLRQAREEQEQKINEAVKTKTCDLESEKFEPATYVDTDLLLKLESLEKENSLLKLELQSQSEELEITTIERDLSTQAAETASKQHLETIKKVAKLETECQKLKAIAYKSSSMINDHKSNAATSTCAESFTDSQSDGGEQLNGLELNKSELSPDSWTHYLFAELDQFKNGKAINRNLPASSVEIDLMDDFLEMEKLAASAEEESKINVVKSGGDKQNSYVESSLRAELEAMTERAAELEKKLENSDTESLLRGELDVMTHRAAVLEKKLENSDVGDSLRAELEDMTQRAAELEKKLENSDVEDSLRAELEAVTQRAAELENSDVEDSLRAELEAVTQRAAELEKNLEDMETEKAELQTALRKSSRECTEASQLKLRETEMKLEELQRELDNANESKQSMESQLISTEADAQTMSTRIEELQRELDDTNELKHFIESQLIVMDADARTLSRKVDSLQVEVQKERDLSAVFAAKCKDLEEELFKMKQEDELRNAESLNCQPKIKQEDLSEAAGKLEECQKTIASLGKQLKSLATLEDFLIDTPGLPDLSAGGSLVSKVNGEPWRLHSNGTFSPKRESGSPITSTPNSGHTKDVSSPGSSYLATSSTNHGSMEKNRNGFSKFFSRSKNGIQLEI